jgi:hypothetical protein
MINKIIKNRKAKKQLLKIKIGNPTINNNIHQFNKILFCPLNGTTINTIREEIIALSCKMRGADVSMLYLDTNIPISEFYNSNIKKLIYNEKIKKNIIHARKLGITTYKTSDYDLKNKEAEIPLHPESLKSLRYKGILIGDLIVASTVRTYLSNGPDWNNPDFIKTTRKVLKSAQMLTNLYNKLLDEIKPDKLVMSHGIYISWGILFRLARKKGIAVDVYGSSYRKDTLRFYHNTPNAPIPEGEWKSFKSKDLNNKQINLVNSYIKSRETQKDDNISLFDEEDNVSTNTINFLEKYKEKKIFCLFTNIAWDAFAFSEDQKFDSMNQWIKETIDFFNKRNDAALIIKIHPAEVFHKTPLEYRVRTYLDTLTLNKNILIINETERVKPFYLYNKINFGLIHISTVGIEMALQNISVLTSGAKGHYSNKGFTIDPISKEDYFNKLKQLISKELVFSPDIETAKKYMYFRFFREAINFDLINTHDTSTINSINIHSINDLEKGKNESLDIICSGILNNSKFININ